MSNFSHALTAALKDLDWTQKVLCEKTDIKHHQMSKYARGTIDVGFTNLELLAKQFPPPQRGQIVRAWLLDHTPECASGLVTILTQGAVEELPELLPQDIDPELKEAIVYLSRQAVRHKEIRDIFTNLHAALIAGWKEN